MGLCTLVPAALPAAPLDWNDVKGIFKKNCVECHSQATGKKKSGYAFDDIKVLATDIGRVGIIIPGKPEESRVIEIIKSPVDADNHMPPKREMSRGDIAKIEKWITDGAILDPKAAKEAETASTTPKPPPAAPQQWKNADGRVVTATFLKLEEGKVHLRLPNGQTYKYPLEKLAPESQEQAKKASTP